MNENEDETRAWVALALCAEGRPDAWLQLARVCGGAVATVTATDEALAGRGASRQAVERLRSVWPARSDRALQRCRKLGIQVAAPGDSSYPEPLLHIADPPLALFWRGADPASCAPALAVVGARRCTAYGERAASLIGREAAAAGVVVISGLARGIDAAAHRGALETGRTAAVLAGGLDRVYPGEHRSLAERIVDSGGCLMSEQPPGVPPLPWLFPFRNRLITGLSLATVVVEAALRSGSLASARHALDQGRDVFAVPGPIDSPTSAGPNRLLRQGASTFCEPADLGAVAGLERMHESRVDNNSKTKVISVAELAPDEARILTALSARTATADEICMDTALDGTRVLALLTALELDGLVRREDHGRFRALARCR